LGCEIVPRSTGVSTRGWTKNVSSSGVLFTAEERIAIGDSIDYLIVLPRFRRARRVLHLQCAGRVLREDPDLAFAASMDTYKFVRVRRQATPQDDLLIDVLDAIRRA
jgi:hypothetical protein